MLSRCFIYIFQTNSKSRILSYLKGFITWLSLDMPKIFKIQVVTLTARHPVDHASLFDSKKCICHHSPRLLGSSTLNYIMDLFDS